MNESDLLCPVCCIRFVLGCELLHVAIHMTTENKIGWGNPEYDVRMVFSETTTGVMCMARKCQRAKQQRKIRTSR